MGYNLTEISNTQINTQEQSGYSLVFVPLRSSEISVASTGQLMSRFPGEYVYSLTQGGTIKYQFRGRRIGVILNKVPGYGRLTFDVDGVAYSTYDCNSSNPFYSTPHIVATDLDDTNHTLTITKLDSNGTSVGGFLVDDASTASRYISSILDYHMSMNRFVGISPINILITDTTLVNGQDFWLLNAIITNTAASPVNVTLKNSSGVAIIGPFSIPANDFRQIPGPIYFSGGMKAIASATGTFIMIGGQ